MICLCYALRLYAMQWFMLWKRSITRLFFLFWIPRFTGNWVSRSSIIWKWVSFKIILNVKMLNYMLYFITSMATQKKWMCNMINIDILSYVLILFILIKMLGSIIAIYGFHHVFVVNVCVNTINVLYVRRPELVAAWKIGSVNFF